MKIPNRRMTAPKANRKKINTTLRKNDYTETAGRDWSYNFYCNNLLFSLKYILWGRSQPPSPSPARHTMLQFGQFSNFFWPFFGNFGHLSHFDDFVPGMAQKFENTIKNILKQKLKKF